MVSLSFLGPDKSDCLPKLMIHSSVTTIKNHPNNTNHDLIPFAVYLFQLHSCEFNKWNYYFAEQILN